jgi:hypothetical protein
MSPNLSLPQSLETVQLVLTVNTYYLGGFYSGGEYQVLSGVGSIKGNYGFYFEAQQMIYRYGGPGSDIGLTPWIGVTFSPQQSINQLPLFVLAGAVYHGLIPGPRRR